MYAVVRTGNKQYRVEEGSTIDVEKMPQEAGEQIELTDVLLIGDGDNTVIGQPTVDGASVTVTVVEQWRSKRIIVFRYRQRTKYRSKRGHRQHYTRLHVDAIKA
ncbi:MAG: 50S ribosomal protein L21 [Anaerolineae bacterium]|nr:50S ribosomal protein L21 [Anaerolineae bacterium]